jgi:hypothetical protein
MDHGAVCRFSGHPLVPLPEVSSARLMHLITIKLVNDHIDRRGEEFIFYLLTHIEVEGLAGLRFVI